MRPHHNLQVWQKAIELVKQIYAITGQFPAEEKFGLVSQMRRSAVSIPSNISEGAGRNNKREFNQFLGIAQGSCSELETQIIISKEIGLMSESGAAAALDAIESISKMIAGLRKKVNSK